MGSKYLYGAAVQGIQGFIFQTSKLTEIVGASELVEQICTTKFWEVAGIEEDDENIILNAAGNIKYIFESKEKCEAFVRVFPKDVMEMAPGITISQAVVDIQKEKENAYQILENRLRVQRNKSISITHAVGLMVTETARRTGGVGVDYGNGKDKGKVVDNGQFLKAKASEKANKKLLRKIVGEQGNLIEKFPYDIGDISAKEENKSWVAVIHADGNNLGQLIIDMTRGISQEASFLAIKNFSKILNDTTEKAAKNAFEKVITSKVIEDSKKGKIPFRPVVLGGDDLTAIIRADLALDYAESFLKAFEALSKNNFKNFAKENNLENNPFENGLTACAGIAYIKANYPFHYGVTLAETLCKEAKRISKDIDKKQTPSSVMFHKVSASFVEEYEDIIDTELKAKDLVYFNYGPYFIHSQESFSMISDLKSCIADINRKTAPKAGLRNWLTELNQNPGNAKQLLARLSGLNKEYSYLLENPFTEREVKEKGKIAKGKFTPIYDIIALSGIQKSEKI